jgi:biopolymer transport protein ExbB
MLELLWDKAATGGPLLGAIALVSLVAWTLIFERFVFLRRIIRANRKAHNALDRGNGLLPAPCAAAPLAGRTWTTTGAFDAAAEEIVLAVRHRAARGLAFISRLGALAPLLGLLGTVTGMIVTFEAITLHGTANPQAMSEGISQALLTTQAGLLTAIPVLLVQRYLARQARRAEDSAVFCLARARQAWCGQTGPAEVDSD